MIDGSFTQIGSGKDSQVQLLQSAGVYIFVVFWGSTLAYLDDRFLAYCNNKVAEYLRNKTYQVMQNLLISYFYDSWSDINNQVNELMHGASLI